MLESVAALSEAGWRVVVTLPVPGPLVALIAERGGEVSLCPSPVLRKSAMRPAGFVRLGTHAVRSVLPGNRLLRRLAPDLVYVSTMTLPLWLLLGRLRRTPVLTHVHEAERSVPWPVRRLLALPLLASTSIVTNSQFSARVLRSSFAGLARRTTVIYNAVPGPPETVPVRDTLAGPVRLLYVGRLSPRKGVDVAIDTIALLAERGVDVSLEIVGAVFPGYEWYEQQLRDQVRTLGLTERVAFRGFEVDIWRRLEAADMVLVPSRGDEPFGNTAVEAVLAGRPVIVSATSGLLEAARGYSCARVVTADDPSAIATAVEELGSHWAEVRTGIAADTAEAAERSAPARYHQRVAALAATLVRDRVA